MRIRRMEEDCYSTQLIERDGEFNVAGLEQFMRAVKLAKFGLSYAVVSIMGPQGSGKSTLLNHLFGTNFREMDAFEGRNKTTNGIWIAKAVGIEPCTIVLDLEGTDGREREDDTAFEKQSALFALAISDVVLINMWCHDIGREQAANKPLLKTVFQVMMRLFNPRKITLLFVIRDKTKTPMEHLEPVLREDIQKIWDTVSKTQARKDTALSEYFNVEVTALPSYEEKEKQFKEQVAQLRQRFFHSIAPGGLAGDRRGVIPASGFSFSAQQIWKVIRENKDLDLPAHKVMVATFRCEQIAHEKFSRLISDEGWLELEKAIQSGPVPGFGEKLSSILDAYLSEYDMEAIFFDEHVRTAKKKELESRALDLVHPAFQTVLGHLRFKALEKFKIDLDQSLKSGKKFAASVRDCTHSSMLEFDRECLGVDPAAATPRDSHPTAVEGGASGVTIKQANWDTSKTKEKLRRDIEAHVVSIRNEKLSELKTNYEKQLTEALAKPVESLFYSAGQDTWASIRQLYKRETENALSRFSTALSGFELDQTTYDVLVTNLNEFARSVVENKAREEAGKVLIRMKDRFSTVFSHDKNSMPRVWTGKENIQMITKDADVSALKLLSVMAAIRLDEKPDKIESILNSTLLEGPVSKDRSIEASTNLLASNTWEEVPPRNTLITPLQCIDIWKQFKAETEYNIYQAIYAQEALRRNKNWLPPPWAIIALAILGFDEFMMLLRNPRYPLVLFVIFLLSTALWVQLDITGAFRNGMLSGILLVSSRFLLKLSGILLLSSRFLLKVMSFLRRLAYLGQRQHEAPQPPRRPPPRSSRSFRSQSQSQAPLSNSVPDSSSSSATIASRNDVESSPLRRRQVGESDAGSSALQVVQH